MQLKDVSDLRDLRDFSDETSLVSLPQDISETCKSALFKMSLACCMRCLRVTNVSMATRKSPRSFFIVQTLLLLLKFVINIGDHWWIFSLLTALKLNNALTEKVECFFF